MFLRGADIFGLTGDGAQARGGGVRMDSTGAADCSDGMVGIEPMGSRAVDRLADGLVKPGT